MDGVNLHINESNFSCDDCTGPYGPGTTIALRAGTNMGDYIRILTLDEALAIREAIEYVISDWIGSENNA